jgi:D-glycero-D-manno-heptose 1,7-bisphosphate phosphatase
LSGKAAVFFDRDGVLNREVGYVTHLDDYTLYPRSAAAVRCVNEAGMLAILVTNQAGAARRYFPKEMIDRVHEKLVSELASGGAHLDAIYYCPYHPNSDDPELAIDSDMRKPKPGMLFQAARDHVIDLARSYMIGDKYTDVECGWAAGCQGAYVLTGYGRGSRDHFGGGWSREPDILTEDAYQAVQMILAEQEKSGA